MSRLLPVTEACGCLTPCYAEMALGRVCPVPCNAEIPPGALGITEVTLHGDDCWS